MFEPWIWILMIFFACIRVRIDVRVRINKKIKYTHRT